MLQASNRVMRWAAQSSPQRTSEAIGVRFADCPWPAEPKAVVVDFKLLRHLHRCADLAYSVGVQGR